MLSIRSISVHYGPIRALHDVSLDVDQGQIATIIGCNGAGKSTTLRAISGLARPSAGEILFEGKPIHARPAHEIVRLGIAHSPEGRGVFPQMTVDENLELGAFARADHAAIRDDRDNALALFPRLRERLTQVAGTLSGGEQQMLAMARALLARPRLLLLDEPSLGLAPQIVQTIFKIIREINQRGTTVLLVEQNAHMALHVAHRAFVLEVGRVAMQGPAQELAASDSVRKAYLGIA
jgi:branched-chain amino acid transport system ATP-binding protein